MSVPTTTPPAPSPARGSSPTDVRIRPGTADDVDAVLAMHERCSALTLYRRYHAPLPGVTSRMARRMLEPRAGWSLVAECGDRVVAMAAAGPVGVTALEVGVLVEDAHQGAGLGARLLRETAVRAADRGCKTLVFLTQPENTRVLGATRRAGLLARIAWQDGLMELTIPLRALR